MTRINYKSDFDFLLELRDAENRPVVWPGCDWVARFRTSSAANTYTASCIGGKTVNCYNDNGKIHVVCDAHRLSPGRLQVELHCDLPDAIYPDGHRHEVTPLPLDIELVNGPGDVTGDINVELVLPAIYLTAYDLAVRNGYTGTMAEYMEYVNRFPSVVETSETVMRLMRDIDTGKALMADALTRQGVDTAADETISDMADKVLDLRLAVEGDPSYVEHMSLLGRYDLYNEMRNHQKAKYPYMYAVTFLTDSAILSGADAYLCSDGFFSEENCEHTFPCGIEHYVIYYFRNEEFTVSPTAAHDLQKLCVFNGLPVIKLTHNELSDIAVYGDKGIIRGGTELRLSCPNLRSLSFGTLEEIDNVCYVAVDCSRLVSAAFPALKNISGGIPLYSCGKLVIATFPVLETISGSSDIAYNCYSLRTVHFPKLRVVYGGWLFDSCNSLTSLSFPALETITGGTMATSCNSLTSLSFPALETITGGTIATSCNLIGEMHFPALKKIRSSEYEGDPWMYLIYSYKERFDLYLDSVEEVYTSGTPNRLVEYSPGEVHLHMPKAKTVGFFNGLQVKAIHTHTGLECKHCGICAYPNGRNTTIYFHIAEGAIMSLDNNLDRAAMDVENMREVISRLGDNTGNPTLRLTFGSTAISKLSPEDLALVTSKNYTLL